MNNTKKLIAQIHIGKKQLGLDEDTYRALLEGATGKTSCSDMSSGQLNQVVKAMRDRGFKPRGKASPRSRNNLVKSRVDKLRAIWIVMAQCGHINDGSDTALLHWVQGQLEKRNAEPLQALNWLETHRDCNLILEQLKRWRDRVFKAALNADLKTISDAQREFELMGKCLSQTEVIQVLLDHGIITWHELFNSMGLSPQSHYTGNRKHLRPLGFVLGTEQCS